MRKHHSRIVKFSFSKRNQKPPQENTSPFPFLASSRDIDFLNPKGAELMKITQISPLPVKPCLTEGSQPLRITQHFRITRSPSPIKRRHDELNPRVAAFSSQGSFTGETQQENVRTDGSQDNRVAVLMERLEKKEQEKEKEKENIIKFTRQSQRIPRQQQIVIEEEKGEGVRFKAPSKEQISDSDMRKIMIFFRYRISLLAKLVEDKAHGGGNVKGMKPKLKLANLSTSGASPYSPATSPAMGKTGVEPVGNEDVSTMDEVWRIVKFTASTRSKYKFRDVVNYNKRLRETVKSLFPLNLSNQRRMVSINLEDETPTKSPTKKIKFSEEDKANAYNDFVSQRKENPNTKVYIVIGAYPALRKALDERGWIENPDHYGKEFNLKWTSKVIDINYNALKPNQLVNHFADNILITTKVGLARNIRNLIWNENEDIDHYYPRCFDLNDVADFDDFLEDFKFEQAVSVLKAVRNRKEDISAQSYNLLKLKLCIAVGICEKRVRPFEMIVHNLAKSESMAFTQEEWELMNAPESENVFESAKYTKLIRTLKIKYKVEFNDVTQCEADDKLLSDAESILTKLEKEFPQFALNQGKNIWIVKPSSLSRGRGICCYNSLASILDHIQIKESEWVAQKYIENPLIIKNRKFDIRQWVLVTDWSPLTIWFFDECYIRFSAHEFNPEDLTNKFAHLTNNAIGRNAANFETSEIDGNMWSEAELGAYMQEVNGTDVFNESIKKQMKNIIIKSMHSSPEIMESRKNTFELFGYDFMIDENYKTWMIEINSSPSMDYSTSITERLVKTLLEDIVKVVVDYGMSKAKNKKNINTGKFQCIYYGKPC